MKLLKGCYLLLAILGFSWAYGDTNTANNDGTCLPICMSKCVGDNCYSDCSKKCLFNKKIDPGKIDNTNTGNDGGTCLPICMSKCVGDNCYSDCSKKCLFNKKIDPGKINNNDNGTCVLICMSKCTGPKDKCFPNCTETCFIDSLNDKSKTNPFDPCDQSKNVYQCMSKNCQGKKDTRQCRYTCCTSSYSGSKGKTCCGPSE